jgi:sarcosine oxidase subunit gamma
MPDFAMSTLPPATRLSFRGRPAAVAAAGTAFDVPLPQQPCRAATRGDRAALWLGPDEWLLIAPEGHGQGIAAAMGQALAGLPCALVDVSHSAVAFDIGGARAATVLSAGCPLDLDLAAFPVGMCTRTILAKAGIMLWRIGPERFRLECSRSFAAYVSRLLEQSDADWAA